MKAFGLTQDMDEAEDLVQRALERALKRPYPEEESAFEAWMTTILRNLFFDDWRARQRRPKPAPLDPNCDIPAPSTEDSSSASWSDVTKEQLARAIEDLEEKYRLPYKRHAKGQSYNQIASALGIPRNTVGTRLRKARELLREFLLGSIDEEGSND